MLKNPTIFKNWIECSFFNQKKMFICASPTTQLLLINEKVEFSPLVQKKMAKISPLFISIQHFSKGSRQYNNSKKKKKAYVFQRDTHRWNKHICRNPKSTKYLLKLAFVTRLYNLWSIFLAAPWGMRDLRSSTCNQLVPLTVGAWSLNHGLAGMSCGLFLKSSLISIFWHQKLENEIKYTRKNWLFNICLKIYLIHMDKKRATTSLDSK